MMTHHNNSSWHLQLSSRINPNPRFRACLCAVQFCGPSHALTVRLWPLPGRKVSVPADEKHQKTVLIMMSNTGGGHKASAEALQQAFQEKYGDKYKVRQLSRQLSTQATEA
eukprot:GHUV01041571.1.p1 GENE.GHUV01041571.1~~GHUV01041571.1.p1  ORF type:complete len:111 (-),score=32.97 GHUV01041571.1:78-410(-)